MNTVQKRYALYSSTKVTWLIEITFVKEQNSDIYYNLLIHTYLWTLYNPVTDTQCVRVYMRDTFRSICWVIALRHISRSWAHPFDIKLNSCHHPTITFGCSMALYAVWFFFQVSFSFLFWYETVTLQSFPKEPPGLVSSVSVMLILLFSLCLGSVGFNIGSCWWLVVVC